MLRPFKEQLEFGQAGEYRVREALCAAGAFVSKFHNTNSNDFQLHYNNQTHRVEVKCEDRMRHTGNICIEVMQGRPSKPSGLAVSEASVCVHTFGDDVALFRRAKMIAHIRESLVGTSKYDLRVVGDNYNKAILMSLEGVFRYLGDWVDYRPMTTIGGSHVWNY